MKRTISILFILSFFAQVNAVNYYLSSSLGSDLNSGKTANTAWKSISKLKSLLNFLQPGDSVFFKCNDSFTGQLILSKSGNVSKPIYFGSYGSGHKPVISGTSTVTNWTQTSANIWEATSAASGTRVTNFFINAIPQQIGRWPNAGDPNKGYLSYESHFGMNQITDNQLSNTVNWTGAEAVVRRVRWILDRLTIQSQSSGTLKFTSGVSYEFIDGFGYFIQNDPRTLDQQGEWYYNPASQKFSLYSVSDPNLFLTQATQLDNLLSVTGQNYITIENLEFSGSGNQTADIRTCSNLILRNNEIRYSGVNAINFYNSRNILFESNLIDRTNNNALTVNGCRNLVMRNNRIKNTALIAGMGLGSDGQYNAVQLNGTNLLAEYNNIDSVGYIGVNFSGDSLVLRNNVISNYCMTKDDGGGLYTWSDGTTPTTRGSRKLIGNIVMNAIGAPEGSAWPGVAAEGIYIDDRSANVDIIGNTAFNCGNNGIFIHNANHINIKNNVSYNNGKQLWMVHDNIATTYPVTNCAVDSNIFVSRDADQLVAKFQTIDNGIQDMGTFDHNVYARPLDDKLTIQTDYVNGSSFNESLTLENWQSKYFRDENSGKSPVAVEPYKILGVRTSNLFTNSSFETGTSGWTYWANYNNGRIEIAKGEGNPGNALKASLPTASGKTDGNMIVISNPFKVEQGKSYRIRFSAKGSKPGASINLIPRKNGDPYNNVAASKGFVLGNTYQTYEFLLEASLTEPNSRIDFQIQEGQGELWFDNMDLVEVDIERTNPDDYIRFEYNDTKNDRNISLSCDFIDAKGKSVSQELILKPFSSVVLFKTPGTSLGYLHDELKSDFLLIPNPASNEVTVKSKVDILSVCLYNLNGERLISYKTTGTPVYTLHNLPKSGLYLVQVRNAGKTEYQKLVIRN